MDELTDQKYLVKWTQMNTDKRKIMKMIPNSPHFLHPLFHLRLSVSICG